MPLDYKKLYEAAAANANHWAREFLRTKRALEEVLRWAVEMPEQIALRDGDSARAKALREALAITDEYKESGRGKS